MICPHCLQDDPDPTDTQHMCFGKTIHGLKDLEKMGKIKVDKWPQHAKDRFTITRLPQPDALASRSN